MNDPGLDALKSSIAILSDPDATEKQLAACEIRALVEIATYAAQLEHIKEITKDTIPIYQYWHDWGAAKQNLKVWQELLKSLQAQLAEKILLTNTESK